jgi:hypothetical protein
MSKKEEYYRSIDLSLNSDYNFKDYINTGKPLPSHLGGHDNISNTDIGAFEYVKKRFNITSMIDIGCGIGEQVDYAATSGIDVLGVDGDYTISRSSNNFLICDLTRETPSLLKEYDLAWSVEFVEHLYEEFIPLYMPLFQSAKYVCMTHAVPGQKGTHHVNCRTSVYWIDIFESYGFELDPVETFNIRKESTMFHNWIRNSGLFFRRKIA